MEAGGLLFLEVRPYLAFLIKKMGIDLSHAYSVVPAWPQGLVFDRSIKQRNPVLLD